MKHKLSSAILAVVLMLSLSLPAFAADCRTTGGNACQNELLWQLLTQYGNCGQTNGTFNWEALLRLWLAPRGEPSAPTEQPQQSETPEQPPQNEAPSQPQQPITPAEPEKPAEANRLAVSSYEQEVARLVNVEREKAGLAPLTLDAGLSRVARMKSQDMHDNGYFDHNSPTYGSPFQLMKSQGITYRTAGENIAMGYRTPEAVVSAWMNSPGHRANILNASYTTIGVGYVADGNYWTQHFIG